MNRHDRDAIGYLKEKYGVREIKNAIRRINESVEQGEYSYNVMFEVEADNNRELGDFVKTLSYFRFNDGNFWFEFEHAEMGDMTREDIRGLRKQRGTGAFQVIATVTTNAGNPDKAMDAISDMFLPTPLDWEVVDIAEMD